MTARPPLLHRSGGRAVRRCATGIDPLAPQSRRAVPDAHTTDLETRRSTEMLNPLIAEASTHAQIADTDEAILRFAVTTRRPDRDVPVDERPAWLKRQERLEIRAELAAHGLL